MSVNATSTETERPDVQSYTLLVFMGVLWGLAVSTSKIGVVAGGHPIGMALWQTIVASLFLLCVALATSQRPRFNLQVLRFAAVCSTCGVAFPAFALFTAAYYLPAGIVAIAFASMPMFAYGLSVIFRHEASSARRLSGVFLGLVAMGLIILPDTALPSPELAPWVLLTLAASLSMSVENYYAGAFRPEGVSSLQLSFARQSGAALLLLPIALVTGTMLPVFEPWSGMQVGATATGLLSAVAYTCLLVVIHRSGVIFASQSSYIITLAGVGWGMLIFGETHSVYIWAALGLTLAAVGLVEPRPPRATGLTGRRAGP
ncbi:MAG: DMT family transporter [Pseudomonadota bacterium]